MLESIGYIFLFGLVAAWLCKKIKLPSLIGMLGVGILLGPAMFDLLNVRLLSISNELREIALIIILMRVGLSLDLNDLKKVGRVAILLCFVPAIFEIAGVMIFGVWLLGISYLDAFLIGTVIAAVSPAVIVPRMLNLIEQGYGKKHSVPQMIMASASLDDVFVIVLFSAGISLTTTGGGAFNSLWGKMLLVPVAVIFGIWGGCLAGKILVWCFKKYRMRDSVKVLILLGVSFLLINVEKKIPIPFSGLLSIMFLGITIFKNYSVLAVRLSSKFAKLWVAAELVLFVLVGAAINLEFALKAGGSIIGLVLIVLLFRLLGVYVSTLKTILSSKEKLFCMISYIPKATVQAAIGSIPLSLGLPCGELVLVIAVISIIITAPLGAFLIDISYPKLLEVLVQKRIKNED